MAKRSVFSRNGRIFKRIAFFIILLVGAACGRGSDRANQITSAPKSNTDLFGDTNIVRISIQIPRAGLKVLRNQSWNGGGNERPEVQVTVSEGKAIYTNVALHVKGAAGSFRPIEDRPALTLNFDKFAEGQRFHGLQKLSLNNSVQDPTFLNEKICRELFLAAAVPVPRSDFAVLTLNGRNLGLYVLVEGYNKQFLKRHFENTKGNLYDGGFCREITDGLEVNSGENPKDQSDLEKLATAAVSARQQNELKPLTEILDLDRFFSMAAMEIIQCHWDGYTMNRNNYRLYHSRDSGKMIFMPHGLDQMFGVGDRPDIQTPLVPYSGGLVAAGVLGTEEGRKLYLQRLGELRTNVFKVETITRRLRELEKRIQPILAEFGPMDPSDHAGAVDYLCRNIAARADSIDEQLANPVDDRSFDEERAARAARRARRNNFGPGNPRSPF